MQFLISVIDDRTGNPPAVNDDSYRGDRGATVDEINSVDVFNDKLVADGHWVFAGGLGDNSTAYVIDNRNGQSVLTDGPFTESKEYLGGFWIITATDGDAARAIAAEGSKACNRKVEVRPFLGE